MAEEIGLTNSEEETLIQPRPVNIVVVVFNGFLSIKGSIKFVHTFRSVKGI